MPKVGFQPSRPFGVFVAKGSFCPASRSRRRLHSRCARSCSLRSPLAEVRRSRQRFLGFRNESAHNLTYRQDFIDAFSGQARREQTLMLMACLDR